MSGGRGSVGWKRKCWSMRGCVEVGDVVSECERLCGSGRCSVRV